MDTTEIAMIATQSKEHQDAAMRAVHAGLARASMTQRSAEIIGVELERAEFDDKSQKFSFDFNIDLGYSADILFEEYTAEDFRNSEAVATIVSDRVFCAIRDNEFAADAPFSP